MVSDRCCGAENINIPNIAPNGVFLMQILSGSSCEISLPENALVVLVGITGAGKSTFADMHFKDTQVLSSDHMRDMVSDSENDMEASSDAFHVLYTIARMRLSRGLLTVIDATNTLDFARSDLLKIAAEYDAPAVALVLNVPYETCLERTFLRTDRPFGEEVVRMHSGEFQDAMKSIDQEGFDRVFVLDGVRAVKNAAIIIEKSPALVHEETFITTESRQKAIG